MKQPSVKSQALSAIVRSAAFLAALDNPVLRAIAQSHEHYIVTAKGLAMTEFRLTPTGFCFFIAGKHARGHIVWDIERWQRESSVYTAVETRLFDAGAAQRVDYANAQEAGHEIAHIGEALQYIRSVIHTTLDLNDDGVLASWLSQAHANWAQAWIDASRGQS